MPRLPSVGKCSSEPSGDPAGWLVHRQAIGLFVIYRNGWPSPFLPRRVRSAFCLISQFFKPRSLLFGCHGGGELPAATAPINGALMLIPNSHRQGVLKAGHDLETTSYPLWTLDKETAAVLSFVIHVWRVDRSVVAHLQQVETNRVLSHGTRGKSRERPQSNPNQRYVC